MFQVFSTMLQQMLGFFALMLVGFILANRKILSDQARGVMSRLETYVFLPAIYFLTFSKNCTVKNLKEYSVFFLFGLGFVLFALVLAILLARVFVPKPEYRRNIFRYSFIVANYGYMGNAIVMEMFGDEALFQYMMFTQAFSLFVYTFGVAMLDPRNTGSKGIRLKTLVNPIIISILLGIAVGLLPFDFPGDLPSWLGFLPKAMEAAKNCMSPVAMILTGFVIGSFPIKELIGNVRVYLASLLRLIVLPAIFVLTLKGLLHFIPVDAENAKILTRTVLICTCMPMGLNTVVFPASHGADTRPGAGMALISTLMALVTVPLMFALFGIEV